MPGSPIPKPKSFWCHVGLPAYACQGICKVAQIDVPGHHLLTYLRFLLHVEDWSGKLKRDQFCAAAALFIW